MSDKIDPPRQPQATILEEHSSLNVSNDDLSSSWVSVDSNGDDMARMPTPLPLSLATSLSSSSSTTSTRDATSGSTSTSTGEPTTSAAIVPTPSTTIPSLTTTSVDSKSDVDAEVPEESKDVVVVPSLVVPPTGPITNEDGFVKVTEDMQVMKKLIKAGSGATPPVLTRCYS
jgi:hypothetical protein